jgi:hypothetical protein
VKKIIGRTRDQIVFRDFVQAFGICKTGFGYAVNFTLNIIVAIILHQMILGDVERFRGSLRKHKNCLRVPSSVELTVVQQIQFWLSFGVGHMCVAIGIALIWCAVTRIIGGIWCIVSKAYNHIGRHLVYEVMKEGQCKRVSYGSVHSRIGRALEIKYIFIFTFLFT